MYTVDASVWVNAFDQREPGHSTSRQVLQLLRDNLLPVFLPTLLLAEVAGAISRTRNNPAQAQAFAAALRDLPNVAFVPLDDVLVTQALTLAAQHRLRVADAIYAAVAAQSGCTLISLISLDDEHLAQLNDIVPTLTPAAALADMRP